MTRRMRTIRRFARISLVPLVLALLPACTSTASGALSGAGSGPDPETGNGTRPATNNDPNPGGRLFGALPDPRIPAGSCGMVLWTLSEDQPTPVFRYIAGKAADAVLDRKPVAFVLSDARGANRFGVSASQRFTTADGHRADVRVAFGLGFDGGVYLEQAVITVTDAAGWRVVTPAAGLAGCRS